MSSGCLETVNPRFRICATQGLTGNFIKYCKENDISLDFCPLVLWTFESPTYSDTSVSMSGADRKSSSVKRDGTLPYSKRESYKYSAEVDSIRRRATVLYRPGTTNRSRQLESRYIPCRMVLVPLPVCSFQLNYFIVGSVWSPNSRANPNVSN